jgi:hydrogenase/urease accessory protein HupE
MSGLRIIALYAGSSILSVMVGVGFGLALHSGSAGGWMSSFSFFGFLLFGFALSSKSDPSA